MDDPTTALGFLLSASQKSRQDFELASLNRAAELRKQLIAAFDRLCEEIAAANLARLIRERSMSETERTKPVRSEFLKVRLTPAEKRIVLRLVELSSQADSAAYVRSLLIQDARARGLRWE